MSDEEISPQKAMVWLRDKANSDDDVRSMLRALGAKHKQTPGELARDHPGEVLDLYDAVKEMLADVEAMETADAHSRGRMAKVKWGHDEGVGVSDEH
jgi:hypothetical protein